MEPCYYRVSVKALVVDEDGRFLLARESDGLWDFLGGGLDHGEDAVAALRREIAEESGLTATYISPAPRYFLTAQKPGTDRFFAIVLYEVRFADLQFTPSDECQELRFFTPKEALALHALPSVPRFVELFEAGMAQSV